MEALGEAGTGAHLGLFSPSNRVSLAASLQSVERAFGL